MEKDELAVGFIGADDDGLRGAKSKFGPGFVGEIGVGLCNFFEEISEIFHRDSNHK